MRIRTVKPEWLEDELLASASDATRVLSIALILMADDHGRGRASLAALASGAWCYEMEREGGAKAAETLAKASRAIRELVEIGFVRLYDVGRQRYYELPNWQKHQKVDKPGKPRVPAPEVPFEESSRDTRETLAPDQDLIPHTSDHDRDPRVRAPEAPPIPEPRPRPAGSLSARSEMFRMGYCVRWVAACPGVKVPSQAQPMSGGPWLDVARDTDDSDVAPLLDAFYADDFARKSGYKLGVLVSERARLLMHGPTVNGEAKGATPPAKPAAPLTPQRKAWADAQAALEAARGTDGEVAAHEAVMRTRRAVAESERPS